MIATRYRRLDRGNDSYIQITLKRGELNNSDKPDEEMGCELVTTISSIDPSCNSSSTHRSRGMIGLTWEPELGFSTGGQLQEAPLVSTGGGDEETGVRLVSRVSAKS